MSRRLNDVGKLRKEFNTYKSDANWSRGMLWFIVLAHLFAKIVGEIAEALS